MLSLVSLLLSGSSSTHELPDDWKVKVLTPDAVVVTHQPFAANSLVVRTPKRALILVDSPATLEGTRRLLAWIQARYGELPEFALSSHFHVDASGGNQIFEELGIRTISSKRTARLVRSLGPQSNAETVEYLRHQGSKWAEDVATIVPTPARETYRVEGTVKLSLSGEKAWLVFSAPSHSPDSIGLFFPRLRTLYGGCAVRSNGRIGNRSGVDLDGWLLTLASFQELEARFVIPGHGARFEPAMLEESMQAVLDLRAASSGIPAETSTVVP